MDLSRSVQVLASVNSGLLEGSGSTSALLDSELLLAHTLKKSRAWLLAHPEHVLSNDEHTYLTTLLARRMKHEPIAYIVGVQEFYGREFIVTHDVLCPRPESEGIIEQVLSRESRATSREKYTIVDVGTGSCCLAITAALELTKIEDRGSRIEVFATDISKEALKIAEQNAKKLDAHITFLQGNLLEPFSSIQHQKSNNKNLIILANLPYVPEAYELNAPAKHEPALALFGGKDGLDLYRTLFEQLEELKAPNCEVITESLLFQHAALSEIAKQHGFSQPEKPKDLIQRFVSTSSY